MGAAVRGRAGELTSPFWWWKGKRWRVCELSGYYGVQMEDFVGLDVELFGPQGLWGGWMETCGATERSGSFMTDVQSSRWRFGAG